MTETELQKQVNEYLRTRGIHFFHLQAGGQRGNKRVQCGGLPDLLCYYHGRHCLIELKTKVGTLNERQRVEFEKFNETGFPVQICRSLDEVINAVNTFLGEG